MIGPIARLMRPVPGVAWLAALYVFLLAPLIVVVGASFNGGDRGALNFPPTDLSLRWYGAVPMGLYRALGISLGLALVTALVGCLLGVPAALGLIRATFRGKQVVGALFRAPLQVPAVVIGVSFLQFYYLVGDRTGFYAVDNVAGLMVAHIFMATPYVIGPVGAVLQRFNPRLEEAALILGATRWSTFRRVTLPLIMPGIYAGGVYAFMISFADLPVSLLLAGTNIKTFPVEIFQAMDYDFNPALLAVSTMIIIFSLVAMVLLQRAIGLNALLRTGGAS